MTHPRLRCAALICIGALQAGACQSAEPRSLGVLESADSATMDKVKVVLARAVGVARVELGPGDPTQSPTIAVLPPPLSPGEGRSPATPTLFDITLEGSACFVVRRDTGEAFPLERIACRPLGGN